MHLAPRIGKPFLRVVLSSCHGMHRIFWNEYWQKWLWLSLWSHLVLGSTRRLLIWTRQIFCTTFGECMWNMGFQEGWKDWCGGVFGVANLQGWCKGGSLRWTKCREATFNFSVSKACSNAENYNEIELFGMLNTALYRRQNWYSKAPSHFLHIRSPTIHGLPAKKLDWGCKSALLHIIEFPEAGSRICFLPGRCPRTHTHTHLASHTPPTPLFTRMYCPTNKPYPQAAFVFNRSYIRDLVLVVCISITCHATIPSIVIYFTIMYSIYLILNYRSIIMLIGIISIGTMLTRWLPASLRLFDNWGLFIGSRVVSLIIWLALWKIKLIATFPYSFDWFSGPIKWIGFLVDWTSLPIKYLGVAYCYNM